ncbi:MAG: CPBP family glutamic-type intramembrane protease [Planctomycetota bacterium]|nr:CPBP family glutamic-type intramembrane protease [Planctomycetota bacterium]
MANKKPSFLQRFFGEYEDEELSSLDLEELEGSALRRRLSLSWLALLPLLAVYAAGAKLAAESGVATRNTSELFCGQLLHLFGDFADSAGLIILAVITGAALLRAVSLRWPMGEGVLWSVLEGAGIGLLMGPLLLFFVGLFPAYLPAAELVADAGSPAASRVALVVGGAAWEELLFRLIVYSALLALGRGLFEYLGASRKTARIPAEVFACALSSLAFAAFHLQAVVGWMGVGGEEFELGFFVWRTFAGVLLAIIARSRGLGVAAWAHAIFNVGLVLGAGPGVFLMGSSGS